MSAHGEGNPKITTAIDRLALLLGLADIGAWTYMSFHGGNECQHFFDNPILSLAFVLFITWLLKSICCNCTRIQTALAKAQLVLLFAVFASITFALIVTHRDMYDEVIPGCPRFETCSFEAAWFPKYVQESMHTHGHHPSKCVSRVCQAFADLNLTASQFAKIKIWQLSPLENLCCMPSIACCLDYKNATYWEAAPRCPFGFRDRGEFQARAQCSKWKNDPSTLCYECDGCMVGIIQTAMQVWRRLAMLNISVLVLVIILYSRQRNEARMKLGLGSSRNI